ncbi:cyclopropane-fatty-acyl-phospholipid synthase [Sphingomonas naphthae]|uniref:Cyclopropane-fatty-acyl-phospholipid synthase n=1 Tax=Sphingomonas naphthae TaxID=1813468 RepID=A0ABY7TMZ7_9SPHN|nr:cyclopropane-fatty-acyl-phospholipid synthase family protein [Sphingomonas naphthae]WCT73224.1 cyclopropane-fatty-acyl-phospholipid synthase [Sphingomonas naphthae]
MSLVDRFLGKLVKRGELTLVFADGTRRTVGNPDPQLKPVTVRFTDRRIPAIIAANPMMGAAEGFMDGRMLVEQGDIRDLIDLVRANGRHEDEVIARNLTAGIGGRVKNALLWAANRVNDARKSRQNVAHHYDIGNRLYDLFLDRDRQYSCAYYREPDASLEQAQADKKAHIAAKLDLRPGQRVLDIGCGWGGMALYLHEKAGVDVLGITLSEEQLKLARERAEAAGVSDHVRFELIDYRDVQGPFDRIVSVGMFEHVGPAMYQTFYDTCYKLLAPEGVMLLHTIGQLGEPTPTDPFTLKYIFPGGYNPALSQMMTASETSRLIVSDVEILRLHYAYTIDEWYDRAVAARDQIVALYDERFYRMWTYYLAGARSAFVHGNVCNYQVQYIKRREALPITRDYMAEAEARYSR